MLYYLELLRLNLLVEFMEWVCGSAGKVISIKKYISWAISRL